MLEVVLEVASVVLVLVPAGVVATAPDPDCEEEEDPVTVWVTVVLKVVSVVYSMEETVAMAGFAEALLGWTVTVVTVTLWYKVVVLTRPPRPGLVPGRVAVVTATPP
jgi:hypothetical protein